jgi:hypothetical protein
LKDDGFGMQPQIDPNFRVVRDTLLGTSPQEKNDAGVDVTKSMPAMYDTR